jgi:hypothetical protein
VIAALNERGIKLRLGMAHVTDLNAKIAADFA